MPPCVDKVQYFYGLNGFTGDSTDSYTLKIDFGSKYEHKYRGNWARKVYKGISLEKMKSYAFS